MAGSSHYAVPTEKIGFCIKVESIVKILIVEGTFLIIYTQYKYT